MGRRRSTNEQQEDDEEEEEEEGSVSSFSDSQVDASSSDDAASSSGDGESDGSGSNASAASASAASNQSSDGSSHSITPRKPRRARARTRRGYKARSHRRELQQQKGAAGTTEFSTTSARLSSKSQSSSSWSARERQFETFRSSFIVLPVPEGVARIEKARAYCFHIKSVVNWVIPETILSSKTTARGRPSGQNNKPIHAGQGEEGRDDDEEEEDDEDEDEDDVLLTLGVHVSLFHATSKRFFGNTWVSPEIALDAYRIKPDREPTTNALRYVAESVALNFRAYFLSEIVDANCVGIVELVAYRKDVDTKATVAVAGCGWTILPLFAQSVAETTATATATASNANQQLSTPFSAYSSSSSSSSGESVGVFMGNPRVLWELQGAADWQTQPRHAHSKFHYQLQLYDPLLSLGTGGFLRRNELVGALETIPGLKHGNLASINAGTNPKLQLLREIERVDDDSDADADENDHDDLAAYEQTLASFVRMASLVPKTIQVEENFTLNVHARRVFMHLRSEVEANLVARLKLSRRTIHAGAASIDGGHVSARVLKIALHNGRCFRTRQHTIPLKVDDDGGSGNNNNNRDDGSGGGGDDIMRCAQTTPVRLKGFVFHPFMAVVVALQFTVHFRVTWPPKLKQQAMESTPKKILPEEDVVTVTMASRVVVPSDGKRLFLHDKDHPALTSDDTGAASHHGQRVLHVDLLSGAACRPYTENPVYTPPDHILGAGRLARTKMRESMAFADLVLAVDGEHGGQRRASEQAKSKATPPPPVAEHWAKKILDKADANSVLAQTLNALATTTMSRPPPLQVVPTSPKKTKEERGTSPVRPPSPLKTAKREENGADPMPVLVPLTPPMPVAELSRASKTLLMRYGFVDAHDTTAVSAGGSASQGLMTKTMAMKMKAEANAVDSPPKTLRPELEDIYKAHEIRLHFAAFRTVANADASFQSSLPSRVYFTFQFYRFAPTRTETLRLSNAFASNASSSSSSSSTASAMAKTFLLMRESPANKPSLAIQFDVDTTASQSPLEHREFASYLLAKQLYVDVWDADSLFLLGTCAIPLHELLRQGAGVKKFQGEVDIWESAAVLDESSTGTNSNTTSNRETTDNNDDASSSRVVDLQDIKRPRQVGNGSVIGKLQILLSNYGLKGRHAVARAAAGNGTSSTSNTATRATERAATPALTKSKHRVRARPLVDNNAELYRLLTEQGFYGGRDTNADNNTSHQRRHRLQARSAGDATTLTPKEIDILCELFRTNPRASAPSSAARIVCDLDGRRGLTALLSLRPPSHAPSSTATSNNSTAAKAETVPQARVDPVVTLREHLKRVLERAMDKGVRIHQVFKDFDASGDGSLSYDELERALAQLGVTRQSQDDGAMRQLLQQFDNDGDGNISYEEFLVSLGVSIDKNKREVVETTTVDMETGVREVFQRLQAKGIDIEELFDHFDVDKSGTLEMHELKRALTQCLQSSTDVVASGAKGGKHLLEMLQDDALRALMQRVNKNGDDVVDYHEFLAFCGVPTTAKTPREATKKKRALSQAERKLIKLLLRAMRMGLSSEQLFQQFDSNADGAISIHEFANSLDTFFQTKSALLSEEDLRAITLRFDTNGDGHISSGEFKAFVMEIRDAQEKLTNAFKPVMGKSVDSSNANSDSGALVPLLQWKTKCVNTWKMPRPQVEAMVPWLETVDLLDDKQRVDVHELMLLVAPAPPREAQQQSQAVETTKKKAIGLRLRDFLSGAVGQGVDARGCFAHFDPDGDGEITATELKAALRQLGGQFADTTDQAIDAMVDELDADGSGKISFTEFQKLLPESALTTKRPTPARASDPVKTQETQERDVLAWLTQLLASAVAKGMDIDACFAHFDKDKSGTITRDEFAVAMRELGMRAGGDDESKDKDTSLLLRHVMDRIDRDGSGEISLAEFKKLFPRPEPAAPPNETKQEKTTKTSQSVDVPVISAVQRLRDLLRAAQQGGISVTQSFAHFDVDKDGSITRDEFVTMIQALPGFENVTEDEIRATVEALDANASGSISLDEFTAFVDESGVTRASSASEKKPVEATDAKSEKSEAEAETKKEANETPPVQAKESRDGDAATGETTNEPVAAVASKMPPKGRLQRAGSFSGREQRPAASGGMHRAGTDTETVAGEAARSKAAAAASTAPPGRRLSLAETRAAAKKAITTTAGTTETVTNASDPPGAAVVETVTETVAVAETVSEPKKEPQPVSRRPSLAEARAAAKAAKTQVSPPATKEEVEEGALQSTRTTDEAAAAQSMAPPAEPSAEDPESESGSTSAREAAKKVVDEESKGGGSEPVDTATPSVAVAAADAEKNESSGPAESSTASGSRARRPSLAEARAAGRAATATTSTTPSAKPSTPASTTAAGKPPVAGGGGQRRPSLAETRAAAAAAKRAGLAAKTKSDASSATASPASTLSVEVARGLASLQALLVKAQESGLDLQTALSHFDKDANGTLTFDEFSNGLTTLGTEWATLTADDALAMAKWIDMGGKGSLTLQDFEVFVQTPLEKAPAMAETTSAVASSSETAVQTASAPASARDKQVEHTTKAPPRQQLEKEATKAATTDQTAAAAATAAVAPRRSSLSARSRPPASAAAARAAIKPTLSETDVVSSHKKSATFAMADAVPIQKSAATAVADPAAASATQAPSAKSMAGEESPFREDASPPLSGYECSYEFHSDPAIRSVEVKLRRAAIDAYSRGIFPLRIVQKFLEPATNPTSTSSSSILKSAKPPTMKSELRRVEFLQVLMEMGFSLLSDGSQDGDEGDDGDATTNSGPRMHDHLYARQLERLARYKHHVKEESRAEKALVRAVHATQERAHRQQITTSKKTATTSSSSSVHRFAQDKSQLLRVLSYYRDGHKKSLVYSLLRDQVTTQVALFPSFASLLFAEMAFVNPYPHQERFRLEFLATPAVVDADVVKNSDEWRFYRRHLPLAFGESLVDGEDAAVEHDMIDPHNEVVLDANDRIAIPLKLRWLQPTTSYPSSSTTSAATKPSSTMSLAVRSCTHGHTVALFKMELFAQPFVCHRVLRFVHAATSVWKWTVQCPRGKHLVCLDPSVAAVVESSVVDAGVSVVTLKCRVGAYPSLEEFYVVIYDDEYFARIDEIWQIRIQSCMRLDVHALLGQTVRSELVLRGDAAKSRRHVRCFTTYHHAHRVSFRPAQIFELVGDAYNRIEWRFCAVDLPAPSLGRVRVHLVDVETNELVGAWLLFISLGRPAITKSYDLQLSAGAGQSAAQKKIAYANPWDTPQTIVLRSSDPTRLRPRDSVLQIPPQGQIFLRLVFPVATQCKNQNNEADTTELLLFVNDQQTEQNEECLRFQVRYNYRN